MPVFSATAIQISGVSTPSISKVTIDCFTARLFQDLFSLSSESLVAGEKPHDGRRYSTCTERLYLRVGRDSSPDRFFARHPGFDQGSTESRPTSTKCSCSAFTNVADQVGPPFIGCDKIALGNRSRLDL